jgi:hypothetical protein
MKTEPGKSNQNGDTLQSREEMEVLFTLLAKRY